MTECNCYQEIQANKAHAVFTVLKLSVLQGRGHKTVLLFILFQVY